MTAAHASLIFSSLLGSLIVLHLQILPIDIERVTTRPPPRRCKSGRMRFLERIENRMKRRPPPRNMPSSRTPIEPVDPGRSGVPWYEPVGPAPIVGPIELAADQFNNSVGATHGRRTQQRYPASVNTRSDPEQERRSRLKAEREQREAERIIAEHIDNASARNIR